MKSNLLAVLLACSVSVASCGGPAGAPTATSKEDTRANREEAARRYLKVVPKEQVLSDIALNFAMMVKEKDRPAFMEKILLKTDAKAVESIMVSGISDTFTTAEIDAMSAFYSTKEGKAIAGKYSAYSSSVLIPLNIEVYKGAVEALQEMPKSSR